MHVIPPCSSSPMLPIHPSRFHMQDCWSAFKKWVRERQCASLVCCGQERRGQRWWPALACSSGLPAAAAPKRRMPQCGPARRGLEHVLAANMQQLRGVVAKLGMATQRGPACNKEVAEVTHWRCSAAALQPSTKTTPRHCPAASAAAHGSRRQPGKATWSLYEAPLRRRQRRMRSSGDSEVDADKSATTTKDADERPSGRGNGDDYGGRERSREDIAR